MASLARESDFCLAKPKKVEEPAIIFEDQNLLVVSKPFGMPSQADSSQDLALVEWAGRRVGKPVHLLHRLDRPTGGLVLLSKSLQATRELSRQFEHREIEKVYLAVTDSAVNFDQLELEHFIGKLPGKNFVRAYTKPVRHAKSAKLKARLRQRAGGLTLLEVRPLTGRRHQIRAQLREQKIALLGDFKYGKKGSELPYPGIALWAYKLAFCFPAESRRTLTAPPPNFYPWSEFGEF